jgi:hypothetical protein
MHREFLSILPGLWLSAANERRQMLPGFRTPGLILFDEIVLRETLEYVQIILRRERSVFVAPD